MSGGARFVPIALLFVLVAGLVWRLANPGDTIIRSRLQGQPVPAFALPRAVPGKPGLATADLRGAPHLVNFFASWCVPCIGEAPVLAALKARGVIVDGIAVRDRSADVADFLARHGDPYQRIGSDTASRVQLDLGSSGVPESFVVDARGIIRYQHVGPIEPGETASILRMVDEAR